MDVSLRYPGLVVAHLHKVLLRIYRRLPTFARRTVVRRLAPQFTAGAICLIERADGKVLLIRQSYRNRNHWGLPGGLLRRHESPEDAAIREIAEEVGLTIELTGEPVIVLDPDPRRIDIVFRARPAPGADVTSARPTSPEIVEVAWFSPTELPPLQHETAQAVQALARASYSPPARPFRDAI
jgi:8-oxo-dGTP pyrophosphatase MutT (NUDIX family)